MKTKSDYLKLMSVYVSFKNIKLNNEIEGPYEGEYLKKIH